MEESIKKSIPSNLNSYDISVHFKLKGNEGANKGKNCGTVLNSSAK